jgi:DNA-binding NtrC family response regulator
MKKTLEKEVDEKIKPLLDDAMEHILGSKVKDIEADITEKISKSPLIHFTIDTTKSYKEAKKIFKRQYLTRLLSKFAGNVSEAAKVANVDRRSIHRLALELELDLDEFRNALEKTGYVRAEAVKDIIESTIDTYKSELNPDKVRMMYKFTPVLSKDIANELPDADLTMFEAEQIFDMEYFTKVLEENDNNVSQTARKVGLRYETVHRKLKSLGIRHK